MEAIYDTIGEGYDTTRKADPEILANLSSLLEVDDDKCYLDVACGTGNYTVALARHRGKWFAFDESEKMLTEARSKSSLVDWKRFQVESLGYEPNFFDGAVCTLAIHHFSDLTKAFLELAKVLKPKSKFVIFTATPVQMQSYWLTYYFPRMMDCSCRKMPSLESVESALSQAGFFIRSTVPYFVSPDIQDFFLYSGKHRPNIYLSSTVRNGISSFQNLCPESELNIGLDKLRDDIESGGIQEVIKDYGNDIGDYLFIGASAR